MSVLAQVATLAAAALALAQPVADPAARELTCQLTGMHTFTWDGGGGDGLWTTAANWVGDVAPGIGDGSDGYVCIDAGRTVTYDAANGWKVNLQAIDLAAGTTLVIELGTKIYVHGDQATRPSAIRSGATIQLNGVLGGEGLVQVDGTVNWQSGTGPTTASTIVTRDCDLNAGTAPCGRAPAIPGRMVLGDGGVLNVNGHGVNLEDSYQLEVRGSVVLSNLGYVAADRGTGLTLLPKSVGPGLGQLVVTNNGGWYEGRTHYGITTLSQFVNGGLIRKSAGTQSSTIDAAYSRTGAGTAQVDAGVPALPDGAVHAVTVAPGSTYGHGVCATQGYACIPVADALDKQASLVRIPGTEPGGVSLEVQNMNEPGQPGIFGKPVRVAVTDLSTTSANPVILSLRYDKSLVGAKTVADVKVLRRADSATTYALVPACKTNGVPPFGLSCVDRRGIAGVSSRKLSDGDILMVVRTTQFSRWMAR